ncbi:MAG: WD40/YVTN/BNR-like repeat-containing protein [Gemmatimonadales bacterium]
MAAAGCSSTPRVPAPSTATAPTLTPQRSGTIRRLQAISPVSDRVAWASGVGGTWVLTTDGGETWRAGVVAGADSLEFRDVEGVSETVAYLLAAGPGDRSRIYRTEDGGRSWSLQFTNRDTSAFYDCFAFWDRRRGFTMSDAVEDRFPVVRTTDGGTWRDVGDRLPAAQDGEGAFAASGTCTATVGDRHGWIATGAAAHARILATSDGGVTWRAYPTPIVQGSATSGGASVEFRDTLNGILGGGDIAAPDSFADNVARSADGGRTWRLATRTPFPGAIYGLAYLGGGSRTVVATGPSGAAWSADEGGSWTMLEGVKNYWAVGFAGPKAGWLVGTDGRILKVAF